MRAADTRPKYQIVLDQLLQDLSEGRYKPGQKLPSEAALVTRFRVSRITVGHAVRELQRRGLIDRIAGSGTYVRHASPAREGLLFGLIIPNLGETEIFEPICQAIAAAPGASHALLWPHVDARNTTREEQALQLCRQCISRKVSGVFFAPLELSPHSAEVNRRVMRLLKAAAIPVVLLDRRPDDDSAHPRCDLAGIDNHRAGYLAAEHLLRLGARRIGFLGYKHQASTVRTRIQGYKDALAADAHHVFLVPPEERLKLPAAATDCDAFVCANDRVAGRLMHHLLAQGVRIPRDVRIVGIDDVRYAELLPVPLTTVHQPCRDIGEAALRLMVERIERPKMPARELLLDCDLVVRQSCGAKIRESSVLSPHRKKPRE
jgi:GntR family transcriptional regulator, arabinose operon transcriptional repressor